MKYNTSINNHITRELLSYSMLKTVCSELIIHRIGSLLSAVVRAYSRMGLTVNTNKTEIVCQWSSNIPPIPTTFAVSGEQLSAVPSFRYLESILSGDTTIENEAQNGIKQAVAAFGKLQQWVFINVHLSKKASVY